MEQQAPYVADVEDKANSSEPAAPPDPKAGLIARRDQLTAALQENRAVIRQIQEELANRQATEHRIIGQIQAYQDMIGETGNAGNG